MALSDRTKQIVVVGLADKKAATELCDAVDSPSNAGLLASVDVTMNQAQVQGLFTTPQTLVPSPGVGKAVIVDSIYAVNTFDTAAFEGGSQTLDVGYAGSTTLVSLTNAFLEAGATKRSTVWPAVTQVDPVPNTAVVARLASADATGGGATSTIKVRVFYRIVPSAL